MTEVGGKEALPQEKSNAQTDDKSETENVTDEKQSDTNTMETTTEDEAKSDVHSDNDKKSVGG